MLANFKCITCGRCTNSRGVALTFNNNFKYKIIHKEIDNDENCIMVGFGVSSVSLRFRNMYDPSMDSPGFFQSILKLFVENQQDPLIFCGDLIWFFTQN